MSRYNKYEASYVFYTDRWILILELVICFSFIKYLIWFKQNVKFELPDKQ